jgi:hypothetical protein
MKRIAIFGTSGCGREVLPLARQQLVNLNAPTPCRMALQLVRSGGFVKS